MLTCELNSQNVLNLCKVRSLVSTHKHQEDNISICKISVVIGAESFKQTYQEYCFLKFSSETVVLKTKY